MSILAIDPGNVQSAYVIWDGKNIEDRGLVLNIDLIDQIQGYGIHVCDPSVLVVEMVASYGMPVGATVFETCVWIGRFIQSWRSKHHLIFRKDIKMHLCHSMRAKDSNIRQALVDRFGPPGTKKDPGITYGLSKDMWAAFAVAVTWYDINSKEHRP